MWGGASGLHIGCSLFPRHADCWHVGLVRERDARNSTLLLPLRPLPLLHCFLWPHISNATHTYPTRHHNLRANGICHDLDFDALPSIARVLPVMSLLCDRARSVNLVVRHPWLVLSTLLLVLLPTAYFGVLNFTLSDPEGGQLVRDSAEAEQAHAFLLAAERATSAFSSEAIEPQQTQAVKPLKLYYTAGHTAAADEGRQRNVLTVANIQKIAALEDALVGGGAADGAPGSTGRDRAAAWGEVCLRERGVPECAPLLSIIPYLRNATDQATLHAAIDDLYAQLDGSIGSPLGGARASWFFEQARPRASRYESYILRTHARLGAPLGVGGWYAGGNASAFRNWTDRRTAQEERMLERFLRPAESLLRETATTWRDEAEASGARPGAVGLLFAQDWLYTEVRAVEGHAHTLQPAEGGMRTLQLRGGCALYSCMTGPPTLPAASLTFHS